MVEAAPSRTRGRPRDTEIDQRVLAATRELLVERGFEGTIVQAISERSGAHVSAIYRRWPSRLEIIEEAIFPGLEAVTFRPTGDLRKDLRRFIRAFAKTLGTPENRAAMPGLLSRYQTRDRDVDGGEAFSGLSIRPQFHAILNAALPGLADPVLDVEDVFDVLLGAMLGRLLVPTIVARKRSVEPLVEMVVRILQPGSPA